MNPYGHGPLVYDFSINVTVPSGDSYALLGVVRRTIVSLDTVMSRWEVLKYVLLSLLISTALTGALVLIVIGAMHAGW